MAEHAEVSCCGAHHYRAGPTRAKKSGLTEPVACFHRRDRRFLRPVFRLNTSTFISYLYRGVSCSTSRGPFHADRTLALEQNIKRVEGSCLLGERQERSRVGLALLALAKNLKPIEEKISLRGTRIVPSRGFLDEVGYILYTPPHPGTTNPSPPRVDHDNPSR